MHNRNNYSVKTCNDICVFLYCVQIRIASTLGGFFLMMVLLVLYKSKCKTRSLSDQHLEAVIKAAVDQEEQLAALAKRSSSSSYCSGHGLCRCSPSKMLKYCLLYIYIRLTLRCFRLITALCHQDIA